MTTDAIVEAVGGERLTIVPELQKMRAAELVRYAPRNGWRLADQPPAQDPAPSMPRAVEARTPPASKLAPKKATPKKKATAAAAAKPKSVPKVMRPVRMPGPRNDSSYIFGITEDGELTITDPKDFAKTLRISADDTARLSALFDKWHYMIPASADSPG